MLTPAPQLLPERPPNLARLTGIPLITARNTPGRPLCYSIRAVAERQSHHTSEQSGALLSYSAGRSSALRGRP